MKLAKALAVLLICTVAAFLAHAIREAREAARESSCRGHMNQLELALRNYEAANGHLPPAYIVGPDGRPWHSWRVLILPFMEHKEVFDRYRFDEPWDGPNNRKLAEQVNVEMFQCPSGSDFETTPNTNYTVVVGEGTAFPDDKTTRFADFSDGVENTVLLVEVADSGIHWMEPRDLRFESLAIVEDSANSPAVSSSHPRGPGVVFADKITAYRLRHPVRVETLRKLLTISGGEPITCDSLMRPDRGWVLSED